jgi:PAS domain-containing protein
MEQKQPAVVSEIAAETPLSNYSSEFAAQTIDFSEWFDTNLTSSGSFDLGIMAAASFCKLLDVLAIPALLVDWTYSVVFANKSCARVMNNVKSIEGVPFPSLVPRSANAEKAQMLIRKVFRSRRPQVAEGILELEARKIWGRLYFCSVRVGPERYVLVMIEDLTNEKTKLLVTRRELQRITQLLADLEQKAAKTEERLRREEGENSRLKRKFDLEGERLRILMQMLPGACAIITGEGLILHMNSRFRDSFALPRVTENCSIPSEKIIELLKGWGSVSESTKSFEIADPSRPENLLSCTLERIDTGEFLLVCN